LFQELRTGGLLRPHVLVGSVDRTTGCLQVLRSGTTSTNATSCRNSPNRACTLSAHPALQLLAGTPVQESHISCPSPLRSHPPVPLRPVDAFRALPGGSSRPRHEIGRRRGGGLRHSFSNDPFPNRASHFHGTRLSRTAGVPAAGSDGLSRPTLPPDPPVPVVLRPVCGATASLVGRHPHDYYDHSVPLHLAVGRVSLSSSTRLGLYVGAPFVPSRSRRAGSTKSVHGT
jgi:hypothetical protein